MVKDQTYFLSYLSQAQLKRLVLPLGCIPKDEVRRLARKFDLPNQERRDSQGICFLGKIRYSEFVERHIGEKEGILLEAETYDFLGVHMGFLFYTIGQRQGLGLPGGPWYVVEKDVKNNVVFVSRNYYSVDKRRRSFLVGSFRWISGSPPHNLNHLRCKVRHGPLFYDCSLHIEEKDGVILESWDDAKGFPVSVSVSDKARHIAKTEDKSKLGKEAKLDMFELPAKIKMLPDPWTPESGLVTTALKLKREQLKAKFKDDL
ncbi:unnamed protein product [Lactuca virosa]|nr:unnamed protein product [Lactuca virosa]